MNSLATPIDPTHNSTLTGHTYQPSLTDHTQGRSLSGHNHVIIAYIRLVGHSWEGRVSSLYIFNMWALTSTVDHVEARYAVVTAQKLSFGEPTLALAGRSRTYTLRKFAYT